MKQSNTKKALFLSVLSLVLCIAMLIGTTFAWFTDSASTKNNRIIAGNLDVDLVMDKTANGTYTSIADSTGDLFKEAGYAQNSNASLWEPGKTQIVYLGVQNKGNLALKYNILVNTEDIDGTPSMVQNGVSALEFALLDETKASDLSSVTNWSDLKAMATAKGDLTIGQFMAAENGCLDEIINGTENETDYFALAVHMKEDAGNEYQGKDITVDVTVVATQKDAEADAFGNSYDSEAEGSAPVAPVHEMSKTEALDGSQDAQFGASGAIQSATLPKEEVSKLIPATGTNVAGKAIEAGEDVKVELTLNVDTTSVNEDSVTYEINLVKTTIVTSTDNSVRKESTSEISLDDFLTANIQLVHGLKNVAVIHNSDAMTEVANEAAIAGAGVNTAGYFAYDQNTGTLSIWTKTFSPFTVKYEVDKDAVIYSVWDGTYPATFSELSENDIKFDSTNKIVTISSAKGFAYLGKDKKGTSPVAEEVKKLDYYNWTWTVELDCNIDLNGKEWENFDLFCDFDGKNHIIKNGILKSAIFKTPRGVKNLVVDNVTGGCGVAQWNSTHDFKNITVKNSSFSGKYASAIVMNGYGSIIDCQVIDCNINAGVGQKEAGALVGIFNGKGDNTIEGNLIKNCTITSPKEVGGLVGRFLADDSGNTSDAKLIISKNEFDNVTLCCTDNISLTDVQKRGVAANNYLGIYEGGAYASCDKHIIEYSTTNGVDDDNKPITLSYEGINVTLNKTNTQ